VRRGIVFCILGILVLVVGSSTGCAGANAGASPQAQPTAGTPAPQKGGAPDKSGNNPAQAPQKGGPAGGGAAGGTGKVVNTAQVATGDVKLTFNYSGTLESSSQLSIVPKTSGRLEKLMVDVGSQVKAGDILATMEKTTLLLAIQQAEANLKSAQARLATVMAGGRPEDIASAQASLDSAQAKLDTLKNPSPSDVQTAQTTLDKARADLASNSAALDKLMAGATPDKWAAAQASVDGTRASLRNAQVALDAKKAGYTAADLSAEQAKVDQAKQTLTSAQDKYQTASGVDSNGNSTFAASGASSVSAAQQSYEYAKANYDAEVQKLQQMQAGYLNTDMTSAQKDFDTAQANYNSAVAALEQLKKGPLPQDIQTAQSTVDKSRSDVAAAEAKLAQLKSPTDNDVAAAKAVVTQAQQALALKQQPYTAQDIQTAQAAVDVAQVALDTAKSNLADANLVAPFDGVITAKLLAPGAMASTGSPVATLFSSDLSIPISIEEARLSRLKPDLTTSISVSSYPGESFPGKVTSISPSADSKSHTFVMRVVPTDTANKLKAGMFADVVVITEARSNALMVPRDAVVQRSGKDVVFVVADGKAQMRPVLQGIPSGGTVEIMNGLKQGEQVVVVGLSGLNDGDAVRVMPSNTGQPSGQPQQQGQDAPGKTN
jgi:HlyD family secretion protein